MRQSPDIIAKVENSYKRGLKLLPGVKMCPKLSEELQEQREAMKQSETFSKDTSEWRKPIRSVTETKFDGSDSRAGRALTTTEVHSFRSLL